MTEFRSTDAIARNQRLVVQKVVRVQPDGRLTIDFLEGSRRRAYVLDSRADAEKLRDDLVRLFPFPAPDPAPEPEPEPTPEPGRTLLAEYPASKGMGAWPTAQHGGQFGNTTLGVIDSPVFPGQKAFWAAVNQVGGSPRAEFADWRNDHLAVEGTEWIVEDTLYFKPQSWGAGSHHVVMQLGHPGSVAPQQLIEVSGEGDLIVRNGHVTGRADPLLVENVSGAVNLKVRVKFSRDPTKGELEAWVDGALVVPTMRYATLGASGTGYLKQGQYGDSNGNEVVFHGLKVYAP